MTDRHAGYIVVLDTDLDEDDAEPVLAALRMVKGVRSVEPLVSSWEVHVAEERVRFELGKAVQDAVRAVLFPERKSSG